MRSRSQQQSQSSSPDHDNHHHHQQQPLYATASRTPVSPSGPRVERDRSGSSNRLLKGVALQMGNLPLENGDSSPPQDYNGHYYHDTTTTTTDEPAYPYSATLDGTGGLRALPGRPRRRRQGGRSKYHHSRRHHQSFAKRCYARWIKGFASSFSSLFVAVALWYGLGVVSIASSKLLLTHYAAAVPPLLLTLQQLLIGTTLLRFLLKIRFLNSPGLQPCPIATPPSRGHSSRRWSYVSPPPPSSSLSPLTRFMEQLTGGNLMHYHLLAAGIFFSLGFLTTNYAFAGSAASFVETIKASEPISSAVLAWLWQIEILGRNEILSLATIVVGVAFSTLGNESSKGTPSSTPATLSPSLQASLQTCAVVFCANLCFSFRGLYQKLFRASGFVLDDLNLQFRMQQVGVALLVVPALVWEGPSVVRYWWHHAAHHHQGSLAKFLLLSLVNGVCFTGYNLASTFILTRISVVHHAALNCLRRVFAIVCTSVYFQVPLTYLGLTGIGLSTAGFLSFSHYKAQRQRQPKPLSSLLPVSVNPPPAGNR